MERAWAGIDIGKGHHHVVVIDADEKQLLSRRMLNDEASILALIKEIGALANTITWAVDIRTGPAVLVLALLAAQDQEVLYISSTVVNGVAKGYRGAAKTDARDAAIIADQARMRRGMTVIHTHTEEAIELRLLVARRKDLVADRTRAVNRLREMLLELWPALECVLDLTTNGPLVLLTGYQQPADIRRLGVARLAAWLQARGVRRHTDLAGKAVKAAKEQSVTLPGSSVAGRLVAQLAQDLIALAERIDAVDQLLEERFRQHELAEIIESMPGIGHVLGAEFLAAVGGDLSDFTDAGHLAGYAGMSPVPRDSGRISGNMHRPRRYNRGLNRVFYMSALLSVRCDPASRRFYDRKRAEGKKHVQAVIALARRRVNVLWALIRDRRCYVPDLAAARSGLAA
ncbi:IS110 family transposase [Nonomuraea aurantiaca]|uniref:IS110 family transposase n=1 Tax=Nonomuraea aurantiaca TaxID=2878562 RepID=UPI001CDA37BA|nr:IS110 family transposase [Nonomuraea aurantiaca]MCA2229609.1 IS110 family transposase [Nonomuraea aurantiaca]